MRTVLIGGVGLTIGTTGLGPFAIGWVTDNVFEDPMKIHHSMALVTLTTGTAGVFLIALGLRSYRSSLSRATRPSE